MLDPVILKGEKIWTKDNKLAGYLCGATYYQAYDDGHIYKHMNAKGMDKSIYLNLLPRCKRWTIVHKYSRMRLSIPYNKIALLLKSGAAKEIDTHTNFGVQVMVCLDDFNEKLPEIQERFNGV